MNCVCPGAVDTERLRAIFAEQAAASGDSIDQVRSEWTKRIPTGRLQRPEERASSITGACLPIDGGMLQGLF